MSEELRSRYPGYSVAYGERAWREVMDKGGYVKASVLEMDQGGKMTHFYWLPDGVTLDSSNRSGEESRDPTNTTGGDRQSTTNPPAPVRRYRSPTIDLTPPLTFTTYTKAALTLAGLAAITVGAYYYGASSHTASVAQSVSPSDSTAGGGFASALTSYFGRSDAPSESVIPESAASSVGGWASRLGWGTTK